MKQQFVITSRYTILQGTEHTSAVINREILKHVTSLPQYIDKPFVYGHSILTGSVFVMQICLTILWVTTNFPLMIARMDMDEITDHCERCRFTKRWTTERPNAGERDRFAGLVNDWKSGLTVTPFNKDLKKKTRGHSCWWGRSR
jgi:hypothetical protein